MLGRLKGYGSSRKSYGCFSLACGVRNFSITSLLLGIALLLFVSLVHWKTQDIVHFSFEVQKGIRATLKIGGSGPTPQKEGELALSGDYDEQIAVFDKEMEAIAKRLDWWIKRVVWLYAFLSTVRGVIGCVGVGLRDPVLIKTLWHVSIFSFVVDALLCISLPLAIRIQGVRLAWYFWLWLIAPCIYFPYIGWYTCEMIFSYYRVLDMGGTGTEYTSAPDLETLLLPDKRPTQDFIPSPTVV